MNQSTNHIFLVRPANFGFNAETAASNAFQHKPNILPSEINANALIEFDAYIKELKSKEIDVKIINDTKEPKKPDAIFPNNWGSFHADGTVVLYPMEATNRRIEKRDDIIHSLKEEYQIKKIINLSRYEKENKFLEGTGSIIFDHIHQIAYACLSPRTNKSVFIELCEQLNYKPMHFIATDANNREIYHTNVMMCISEKFSVVCLASIKNEKERELIIQSLEETGNEIIDITYEQMNNFAGNMLSVLSTHKKEYLVMSQSAYNSLNKDQLEAIENYCEPLPINVNTIESIGGGSVRCMISEIFTPKK